MWYVMDHTQSCVVCLHSVLVTFVTLWWRVSSMARYPTLLVISKGMGNLVLFCEEFTLHCFIQHFIQRGEYKKSWCWRKHWVASKWRMSVISSFLLDDAHSNDQTRFGWDGDNLSRISVNCAAILLIGTNNLAQYTTVSVHLTYHSKAPHYWKTTVLHFIWIKTGIVACDSAYLSNSVCFIF